MFHGIVPLPLHLEKYPVFQFSSFQNPMTGTSHYQQVAKYTGYVMLSSVQVHPIGEIYSQLSCCSKIFPDVGVSRHGPFKRGDYKGGIVKEVERKGRVLSVSFSPCGKHLAVGGGDKKVLIISTSTWDIIHDRQMDAGVKSVCFSPDGMLIAVGGNDNKVTVFSTSTWDVVKEMESQRRVESVCFSPSGEYLAVGAGDRKVSIIRTSNWELINEVEREGEVLSVCFSPNNELLAVGGSNNMVSIISTSTWKIIHEVERDAVMQCFCFSPKGEHFAVGGEDKRVDIISTRTWNIVQQVRREAVVTRVCFSRSGKYLAVGGGDKKVSIVSTSTWEIVQELTREGFITSICFSMSGEYLAVGGGDKIVSIFNTSIWSTDHEVERAGEVFSVCFSPLGEYLAVGGCDKGVAIICTSTWEIIHEVERNEYVTTVCFNPSGEYLAVGGYDNKVAILSTTTWEIIYEVERAGDVRCVCFSPSGEYLAVGGCDNKVAIICTSTWDNIHEVKRNEYVTTVSFNPSGDNLAVGGYDDKVAILSTSTWEIIREVERAGDVRCVCFSPSGEYLAVGAGDRKVSIIRTSNWELINEVEREGEVSCVTFSPCGEHMAVSGGNKMSVLTNTWEIVQEVEREGAVFSISFSPSGEHVAVGGFDKKVLCVRLGPRLSAEFVPMGIVEGAADGTSTDLIPSYCFEYSPGPTLVERCLTKGIAIDSIANLVCRYPKLLCATTNKKESSAAQIFADAVMKNGQTSLIQTVLTTIFSREVFSQLMFTSASACFEKHFESIISNYPNVWSAVLKDTCFVPWPFLTTNNSKYKDLEKRLPTKALWNCPWQSDVHVPGGDILITVFPISGLFSYNVLKLMTIHCDMSAVNNDAMTSALKILWEHHISKYFYAEFALYCVCVFCWVRFLEEDRMSGYSTFQIVCMLTAGLIVVLFIAKILIVTLGGAPPSSNSKTPTSTVGAENEAPVSTMGTKNEAPVSTTASTIEKRNETLACTRETKHVKSTLYLHFSNGWNIVDVLALSLTMICLAIACVPSYSNWDVSILHVVNSALLTVKFLSYLRDFKGTGWLIAVLLQNMKDMRGFVLTLCVILAGFTVIFRILFHTVEGNCDVILSDLDDDGAVVDFDMRSECSRGPFEQFALVAFGVFNMGIMGEFDTDNFDDSVSPWASRVCFVLLVVVVTVIALNALIALLGDSYSKIQENMVADRNFERAAMIVEYLTLMPASYHCSIETEARYLYVLVPKQDLDKNGRIIKRESNEWEGSINAVKKLFETKLKSSEVKLESHILLLQSELRDMKSELNTEVASLKTNLETVLSLLESRSHYTSPPQPAAPTTTIVRRKRVVSLPRRIRSRRTMERRPQQMDANEDELTGRRKSDEFNAV